jgi:hypothetical protein
MYLAITDLIRERSENPTSEDYDGIEDYAFTNDQIWAKCKLVMDGIDIFGKPELFYSIDYGTITHKRISSLYQSKFKAVPFKTNGDNSKRGWRFQKEVLERIALQYKNEDEIKIMGDSDQNQGTGQSTDVSSQELDSDETAPDASDASHYKNPYGVFNENIGSIVPHSNCDTEDRDRSKSLTEESVSSGNQYSNSNLSNKFNNNNSNNNTLASRYNEQSSISSLNNTFVENNDKFVDIISNSSTEYNNNNQLSKSDSSAVTTITDINAQKIYQNTPYTSLKSDASDADYPSVKVQLMTELIMQSSCQRRNLWNLSIMMMKTSKMMKTRMRVMSN